jgi:hypothetical protein
MLTKPVVLLPEPRTRIGLSLRDHRLPGGRERGEAQIPGSRMLPAWLRWIQTMTPLPAGLLRTIATTRIAASVDTLWWRRSTILMNSRLIFMPEPNSFALAGRAAKTSIGSNASPGAPTRRATVVNNATRTY